jgi:Lrp/AsnC family transcriptional regulator for asnA, asnC and gidA
MKDLVEIDARILKILLRDGRKSFTTIAEECRTSKDLIWKHYNEMEKAGVIVGATIQYNYPSFGYEGMASIMVNVESQHLNEVFERLTKISDIFPYRQYNSAHNIGVIAMLKKLKDLNEVKEILKRQNPITASRTYLWTDVRNTPENLSLGFAQERWQISEKLNEEKTSINDTLKLDKTDLQIVEELTKDGRAPFSRIGQTIGVSTDTVIRRYKRLVQNRFIKVSIQINPMKLGYKAIVLFLVAVLAQNETKMVVESLSKIPNVSYLVKISGDYDLQVAALVRGIEEIYAINEEIIKIPCIGRIEADIRKITPSWPCPRQYISTF